MTGVMTRDFPILALFVFGIVYLVRYFDGPYDILKRFRLLVGVKCIETVVHADGKFATLYNEEVANRPFARLLSCYWCSATWISITVSGAYCIIYGYTIIEWAVMAFAMLSCAGVIHDIVARE